VGIEMKINVLNGQKNSTAEVASLAIDIPLPAPGPSTALGDSPRYFNAEDVFKNIDTNDPLTRRLEARWVYPNTPSKSSGILHDRPQQNETPVSAFASADMTLFKTLEQHLLSLEATENNNFVPRAEKIDYTNKPRTTKGCFLKRNKNEPNSEAKHDFYHSSNIPALQGLSTITRKKVGEYPLEDSAEELTKNEVLNPSM
jgi:hypothetical protein